MKVYITGAFKGKSSKQEIEGLSKAVREAKMDDFCFLRDVEHYKRTFSNAKEKWASVYDELAACDLLLLDLADRGNGRRAVECGMALALKKPVIVTVKRGMKHKKLFNDLASTVIEYDEYKDITRPLKKYERERNFTMNDQLLLFGILVFFGIGSAWGLAQFFIPLGIIWTAVYWWIVRRVLPSMRAFDRIAIYIPLAAIWIVGMYVTSPISPYLLWGWIIGFWFAALIILQRLKFSL